MNKFKKVILPTAVGLTAFAGIAGGSLLNTLSANADTASTASDTATTAAADTTAADTSTATTAASTSSTNSSSAATTDQSKGGHTANGIIETVLTGDTATKAIAAAKTAEPGATVVRAETDAEGATYEVHMTKSDGSQVTVKLDASFNVTSTESGMGGAPSGSSN